MKAFRLLRPDEIECRVQSVKPNGVSLLLYKTARTDADLLDETVGALNWENDFKLIDGVLFGGLGVNYGSGLVWKWDAGVESNTEAEKGRASDAMKRAGFKHGIGRELYSAPFIWIPSDKCDISNGKCSDPFSVASIGYDENERIVRLEIRNDKRKAIVYSLGGFTPITAQNEKKPYPTIRCEHCMQEIKPARNGKGEIVSVEKIVENTQKQFGANLCSKCAKEEKAKRGAS